MAKFSFYAVVLVCFSNCLKVTVLQATALELVCLCLYLELPTAEELMKPIRPEKDHIRGFTLQPVRLEQPNQIISLILLSEQHDLKVRPTVVHSDKAILI